MASNILAFLAGAGTGYLKQQDANDEKAAREEDRAFQREQRERVRSQQAAEDQLQTELKAAAAPASVAEGAGGMVRPDTMDDRDVGLPENAALPHGGLMPMAYRVGSTGYADRSSAQAAADAYNQPEARDRRVVAAYEGAGQFGRASQLRANQMQLAERALAFKERGIFDGLRAFRMGDKDGAMQAVSGSGLFKIEGDATIAPRALDLPGLGKVQTYDLTFNRLGADGAAEPTTINSHQASLMMLPYEKQLGLLRPGGGMRAAAAGDSAAQAAQPQGYGARTGG